MHARPSSEAQTTAGPASTGRTELLTRRARAGDRAALHALYERVAPALYAWTELRLRGGPAHLDPHDVLQEVWLRALRNLEDYDASLSFRAWILGIAKNVLLQSYRRTGRDESQGGQHARGAPALDLDACVSPAAGICERLARDEAVQRFLAYVAALPTADRELVLYCGLEERTSAEAAARLRITPAAARKRWQALRARFRESAVLKLLAGDPRG